MKIALIGSNGQLGSDIFDYFISKGEEVIGLTEKEIDVCSLEKCENVISQIKPELVINTAAFHQVDLCEDRPDAAFAVNTAGVKNVCSVCKELDIATMYFSTDFIFGQDKARNKPYIEEDCPGPLSIYAISKLAGEYAVKYMIEKHYIVRVCGLYGIAGSFGKGYNFVDLMIKIAGETKKIKVVKDQILTPTYTMDVTKKLYELIYTNKYGTYHMTNTGMCSWYEFAEKIFEFAKIKADLSPTTTEEYDSKAKRPHYSVLDNKNLRNAGIKDLRSWQEALKEYIDIKYNNHRP